jgi:hypothetical protein
MPPPNTMITRQSTVLSQPRISVLIGLVLAGSLASSATAQITPDQASQIQSAIGNRIEALTILGGDFGLAGGTFRSTGRFQYGETTDENLGTTKLGGAGDVGDPQPLGGANVGWQPRVQGNLGFLDSTNRIHSTLLEGDINEFKIYGMEIGGGARFWVSDRLSFAPTIMGLYGHTTDNYTATSAFMRANLDRATRLGLVGWSVDTWTLRPAVNVQYVFTWDRAIITLSSDPTYFHTESFNSTSALARVHGDSGSLGNTIDADVPLGFQLFGHEVRTGGYVSRTDLFGGLREGLDMQHINEVHGRLVLDFLGQFWKVQWVGLGVSYVWGPNITGWTGGVDVAFRF